MSHLLATLWLRGIPDGEADAIHQAGEALLNELSIGLEMQWPSVYEPWQQAEVSIEDDDGKALVAIGVESTEHLNASNQNDVVEEFVSRVHDFALVCHIAYPGGLWVESAQYYLDDEEFSADFELHPEPLWSAIDHHGTHGLKVLRHVSLADAWRWFCVIPDVELYYSDDATWRALNYLRYAMHHDNRGEGPAYLRIVWVMMGLEALYGEKGYSRQPAAQKIGDEMLTFLGSLKDANQVDFHVQMRGLYKVRNDLFHGSMSVPRANILAYETKEFDKFLDRMSPVTYLGLALLLATLQELVLRGWSELSFTEQTLYFPGGNAPADSSSAGE